MQRLSLEPLEQPPALRDQVYATLEELIVSRTIPPGARLFEAELAAQLKVGRNPVREALTLLAHSGWVDMRPRHGVVVHTPTTKEVDDFFTVRGVLEEESARLAAQNADEADIDALRRLVEAGVSSLPDADEAATTAANAAFHSRVSAIADNRVLDEVLGLMKKRLRWYFTSVASARGRDSWREHGELVEAIAARDPDRAAQVMRAHSKATADLYRERFRTDSR